MRILFFILLVSNFAFLEENKDKLIEVKNNIAQNDSTYKYKDPHRTTYFFNSSAYSLKKGEKYYRAIWIVPSYGIGISNNLSMEISAFFTFKYIPVLISFKRSIPNLINNDKIHIAVGFSGLPLLSTDMKMEMNKLQVNPRVSGWCSLFTTVTYGDEENHISLSTAIWTGGGFINAKIVPIPTLSGMQRLSANISWIGQLTVAGGYLGLRFFSKKTSWDAGFFMIPGFEYASDFGLYPIPMLGVSHYFN